MDKTVDSRSTLYTAVYKAVKSNRVPAFVISSRETAETIAAVDEAAKARGIKRSQFLSDAIKLALCTQTITREQSSDNLKQPTENKLELQKQFQVKLANELYAHIQNHIIAESERMRFWIFISTCLLAMLIVAVFI